MIFSRSEPLPVVMTWITVCIARLGSAGNQSFCNLFHVTQAILPASGVASDWSEATPCKFFGRRQDCLRHGSNERYIT